MFLHIQVQFFEDQEFLGNGPTGKSCQDPTGAQRNFLCAGNSLLFSKGTRALQWALLSSLSLAGFLGVKFTEDVGQALMMSLTACYKIGIF